MAALGGRPQGDHLPAVQMADGGADHKSKKTDHGTAPEAGLSLMIFVQNVENKVPSFEDISVPGMAYPQSFFLPGSFSSAWCRQPGRWWISPANPGIPVPFMGEIHIFFYCKNDESPVSGDSLFPSL